MIRINADEIALLGHVSSELSQRRRDIICLNLNKDYAILCSSNVPVTALLLGEELQTQLNHICASNKISNTDLLVTLAEQTVQVQGAKVSQSQSVSREEQSEIENK